MKKLLKIVFVFFLITNTYSQEKIKFKAGVKILNYNKTKEFVINKKDSILFVLKADTPHLINHYLDLSRNLKKSFRKYKVKTYFNYEMNVNDNSFEVDVKSIPKKVYDKNDFKNIVYIKAVFTNTVKLSNIRFPVSKRQTHHQLKFNFEKDDNEIMNFVLDIMSYNTIVHKNKRVASEIRKKLLD